MGLEAETVKVDNVEARQDTLAGHGATEEEIEFLAEPDGDGMCRRVELNAMTSAACRFRRRAAESEWRREGAAR